MILSRILRKESPFRHSIAPNVLPFHAPGPWPLVTQSKQTMGLRKHRVHAPLRLAEKLGRGQSALNKGQRSIQKFNYCTIVSIVKFREIFRYIPGNNEGLSHEFNDLFLYGPTAAFISMNL